MTDTIDIEELTGGAAAAKPKNARVWAQAEHQWYVEPVLATTQLLMHERFIGQVEDPCCGRGNTIEALRAAGYDAVGYDLVRRTQAPWFVGERDFLTAQAACNVVMNPPFYRSQGTEQFIRHALAIATGKVAAFVDIRFLAGERRAAGLYAEQPPARIYVITPRVSCPPGEHLEAGGKAENGSSDWCWLVWDKTAPAGATTFSWLRRPT